MNGLRMETDPRCVGCDATSPVSPGEDLPAGWVRLVTCGGEQRLCCSTACGVAALDALGTIDVVNLLPAQA